jgi:hypothetical protein
MYKYEEFVVETAYRLEISMHYTFLMQILEAHSYIYDLLNQVKAIYHVD